MLNNNFEEMFEAIEEQKQKKEGIFHSSKLFPDMKIAGGINSSRTVELMTNPPIASHQEIMRQLGHETDEVNTSHSYNKANFQNFQNFQEFFVYKTILVKLPKPEKADGYVYWIRDFDKNRHVPIDVRGIQVKYKEFCKKNNPGLSQNQIDQDLKYILEIIPSPDEDRWGLEIISDDKIVFKDSYLDLKNRGLHSNLPDRIFNKFSIPIDMCPTFDNPPPKPQGFLNVANHIFDSDPKKIELIFQIIGLIIWTGNLDKRNIFLFQGGSNTWKTTLSDMILRLLGDEEDDREKNIFSGDLTQKIMNEIKEHQLKYRIWYVDETAGKPFDSTLITNLKSIIGGRISNYCSQIKILISTNKAIYESGGRYEYPKTLYNRTILLPFTNDKPNRTAYEYLKGDSDEFLPERPAIIYYALEAVYKLLKGDKVIEQNISEFNKYIEDNDILVEEKLSDEEKQQAAKIRYEGEQKALEENKSKFDQIIDELYEICDELNPLLTTEKILEDVNNLLKAEDKINGTPALGKKLSEHFKKYEVILKTDKHPKSNGKTCYNLKYRKNSSESTEISK